MKKPKSAKDIMNRVTYTMAPDRLIYDAAQFLLKHKISSVPVVDAEGNFLGEFNQQSCLNALLDALHESEPDQTVGEHLRPHQVTIDEDTSLTVIAEKFQQTRQRMLPVLKDKKTIGIITRRDVIAAVLDYLKGVPDKKTRLLYLSALVGSDDAPDFAI